jgi:hypothetical protein
MKLFYLDHHWASFVVMAADLERAKDSLFENFGIVFGPESDLLKDDDDTSLAVNELKEIESGDNIEPIDGEVFFAICSSS